ncbi:MAG: hypothetical protein L6R40_007000 [Gallowayella cf. fulva]|nr:MAG: hypothetical protein L6R40_007000 [Xanthomendoza cf. fulva]
MKSHKKKIGHVEFAPGARFSNEAWGGPVQLAHGMEFTLKHSLPLIALGTLAAISMMAIGLSG